MFWEKQDKHISSWLYFSYILKYWIPYITNTELVEIAHLAFVGKHLKPLHYKTHFLE